MDGLGDIVESATKLLGIAACPSCEARKLTLNKLVPFGRKVLDSMGESTKKTKKRIDKINLQIVITHYNDDGQPLGEESTQALTVFRASTPDVWKFVDDVLARAESK